MSLRLRAFVLAVVAILAIASVPPLSPLHAASLSVQATPATPAPAGTLELLGALFVMGMAIKVKDAAGVARKWVQRAGAATTDYKEGVAAAAGDWETNTAAAEENFAAGVNQAIADKRFGRGVRAAGGAKFAQRASTIGATRFGPGVQASEGAMAQGMGPVLQTIASVNLPPRRPKGDPANYARAQAVGEALRKMKTGR